ncbi:hypothetical protein BH09SUM1_BH09SUM1_03570 [soil metagenome]
MRIPIKAITAAALIMAAAPNLLPANCDKQAMWVWNSSTVLASANNRNKLLNSAIADGFTDIYIYLDDATYVSEKTDLQALISRASCNNIKVWGMEGYRGYYSDTYGPSGLYAAVNAMLTYNSAVATNEKFYGFHTDMEPQDINGDPDTPLHTFHNGIKDSLLSTTAGSGVWKSTQKLDREYLMRDWLDIQKTVSDLVHASGLKAGGSFPSWPDDYYGEPVGVTWNSITQPVYKHMLTLMDDYVVMSYNVDPVNAGNVQSQYIGNSLVSPDG